MTLACMREWVRDLQIRYNASKSQVCFALNPYRADSAAMPQGHESYRVKVSPPLAGENGFIALGALRMLLSEGGRDDGVS